MNPAEFTPSVNVSDLLGGRKVEDSHTMNKPYLLCSKCGNKKIKLYLKNSQLICRECANLFHIHNNRYRNSFYKKVIRPLMELTKLGREISKKSKYEIRIDLMEEEARLLNSIQETLLSDDSSEKLDNQARTIRDKLAKKYYEETMRRKAVIDRYRKAIQAMEEGKVDEAEKYIRAAKR